MRQARGKDRIDRDPVLTAPHDCEDRCTDPSHGAGRLATEVAQESQPLVTPATLPLLTARGAIMPAARRLSPADRQGGRPGASAPAFASSLERSATNRDLHS